LNIDKDASQNKATTTYQIQCAPHTDSEDDCGFSEPFTYIKEGTSSIQYDIAFETATATIGCSLGGTTSAVCTGPGDGAAATGATGAAALQTTVVTTTLGPDDIQFTQIPITGGQATAAQSTGAAATPTSTGASNSKSSMTGSSTASSGSTAASGESTTASGGSARGQATPSPSGSTGGATSMESRSIVALIGAAAMAAVMV
ncbi:MAG: hypothetical protein LQ338_004708, partial [Usnochroma carphineum]